MTISAKVIADSISPHGIRLTTLQCRYPKFIHGEFMTHRMFSRNASSSRAIPIERLIQDVMDDPAMPIFWGKNQPGMQAVEELSDVDPGNGWSPLRHAKALWLNARDEAVDSARELASYGAHKQIVNRLLEPWCHINVIVTATEWSNFFALRRHRDAQPEMRALADAMWEAREASTPAPCAIGGWHLPYYDPDKDAAALFALDLRGHPFEWMIKLSVARCARVSYLTTEGRQPSIEEDLKLYDRLVGSVPLHASPTEHQATPDEWTSNSIHGATVGWLHPEQHGNFVAWRQYRKFLPGECVNEKR